MRFVDGEALCATPLDEFGTEPALADAGLAHHADDLAGTRSDLLEGAFQRTHFVCASDEAGEAPRA